jgi:four helix bundle protein
MQDFRNLEVWTVARSLALTVYRVTARLPPSERYGLTSQLRRAAISVPANIAEGCGRGSDADFARFLYHTMGSASELECLAVLAQDLGYLADREAADLVNECARVKRMTATLLKRLQSPTHRAGPDS